MDNILDWQPELLTKKGEINETFMLLNIVKVKKRTIEEANKEAEQRMESVQDVYANRGQVMDCYLYYEMKEYIKINLIDGFNLKNYVTSIIWLN